MPAYVIALIDIKNPDAYRQYAEAAGPATAKYGGKFLVRGGERQVLEGALNHGRVVVTRFESLADAKRFYDSPEYQAAKSKRIGAADFNMIVAEGVE